MNLDMKNWGQFRLGDLFNMFRGHTLSIENKEKFKGNIPCINGSAENNGVLCCLDKSIKGFVLHKAPALSLSRVGNSGQTFLQAKDFFVADNAFCLKLKEQHSIYVYLFISTILNCEKFKYSYGRTITSEKYKDIIISLPSKSDAPDWEFMENYIKSLHSKPLTTKNKNKKIPALNVDKWEEFTISKLFTLEIGKANQGMLEEGNECFYVGAKRDDNGVMIHCAYNASLVQKGNCIIFICNGEGSVGYANYMDIDFIGTTDIVAGYNKNLNSYNGLFIATVLCMERPKYSFGRKWKTHLKDTIIKLPAKKMKNGKIIPDWEFMENYIKALPYGDRI